MWDGTYIVLNTDLPSADKIVQDAYIPIVTADMELCLYVFQLRLPSRQARAYLGDFSTILFIPAHG